MLPQLSPSVQSEVDAGTSNLEKTAIPGFVNLYRRLAGSVLDHDVSTRSKNQEYDASGVAQSLAESYNSLVRDVILIRALQEICHSYTDEITLPRELRELCYVISTCLSSIQSGQLIVDKEVEDLLADEFFDFRQNLTTIGSALTSHLTSLERTTSEMVALLPPDSTEVQPVTTATTRSRIPSTQRTTTSTTRAYKPSLRNKEHATSSSLLQSHIETQSQLTQTTLPDLLTTLSTTLHTLLSTLSTHLTHAIRHSELYTHSTLSRHLTSQATFLASVAQGLNLKSHILALQREKEAYAEEGVQEALRARWETLRAEERGLKEREERLTLLLAEYEREGGGMEVFETLGRGYEEVETEIEVVRKDVERLEREVEGGGGGRGSGRARGVRR